VPSRSCLDALDAQAAREVVARAEPDAIAYQATALADMRFGRNFDRTFARTNRLRTEGTDNLLAAARETGVHRFVAQSFASMRNAREGGMVKTEDDPLDPDPPKTMREGQAAMAHLEQAVIDAGGIALRYGGFYGDPNDGMVEPVRKRQFPVIGNGAGVLSFIHLDDAAAANRARTRPRRPRDLQHRRRRARADARVATGACRGPRRQTAAAYAGLARTPDRRRSRGLDGYRSPRRLQRQGQTGTRLDPRALPQLATRLHRGVQPARPRSYRNSNSRPGQGRTHNLSEWRRSHPRLSCPRLPRLPCAFCLYARCTRGTAGA
jgi:hypothetical protein